MPFATPAELEMYVGQTFDQAQWKRAELLLNIATGAIQEFTHQRLERATSTVTLYPNRFTVFLPERPVVSITSVTYENVAVAGWTLTEAGIVHRAWPGPVKVTYTHGYLPIPFDIKGVCLDVARRGLTNPEGFVQKTVGDVSVSHGAHSGLAVGLQLADREMQTLDSYRRINVR